MGLITVKNIAVIAAIIAAGYFGYSQYKKWKGN